MRLMKGGGGLLLAILLAAGAQAKPAARPRGLPDSPPPIVSLCKLTAHPAIWNGRVVRVRAVLISDLMHATLLKDRECRRVFVDVYDKPQAGEEAGVRAFFDAMQGDILDLTLRVLEVDAVGRFVREGADSGFQVGKVIAYRRLRPDAWEQFRPNDQPPE